jgi:hypothetical protein
MRGGTRSVIYIRMMNVIYIKMLNLHHKSNQQKKQRLMQLINSTLRLINILIKYKSDKTNEKQMYEAYNYTPVPSVTPLIESGA